MRKRFALIAAFLLALSVLAPGTALAGSGGKASYFYLLGEEPIEGPDIARASNGDTVEIMGMGTIDVVAKTATGEGTFEHKDAGGHRLAIGSWRATGQLVTFQFYGCGLPGLPDACGGRAILRVALTPRGTSLAIPALLQINCLIGNPPSGMDEGVRLNVPGVNNFNKSIHGETLFFRT